MTKPKETLVSIIVYNINHQKSFLLILSYILVACGESKRRDKIKNTSKVNGKETSVKRPSVKGPSCTSVVISDRFVVTSARCVGG